MEALREICRILIKHYFYSCMKSISNLRKFNQYRTVIKIQYARRVIKKHQNWNVQTSKDDESSQPDETYSWIRNWRGCQELVSPELA